MSYVDVIEDVPQTGCCHFS